MRLGPLCVLVAFSAWGQVPRFGDGHHGPLVVTSATAINSSSELTRDVMPGVNEASVADGSSFIAGDAVMLVQMQALPSRADDEVGAFEVRRLAAVDQNTLRFDEPVARAFPAGASQVVTLPEYLSVLVQPGGALLAPAWTGAGGVLAFLVRGTLRNDGSMSASGAGLRGGPGQDAVDERGGCMRADEPAPGGARRGEGLTFGSFSALATGRGTTDTGGGGGMCPFSGGGGGAHSGAGGIGGLARDATAVGGLGGRAHQGLSLLLGGGGGATNGLGAEPRSGGAGGGVVFVRALEVTGFGRIEAHGAPGLSVSSALGAGSGGGAGGTVWLEVDGEATCIAGANGGSGGSTSATGPGGGGGGGFIRVRASKVVACPTSVVAGSPGLASGAPYGAGPLIPSESPHAGFVDVVQGEPGVPSSTGPAQHRLGATGCGCATGTSSGWVLGALLLFRRRRP